MLKGKKLKKKKTKRGFTLIELLAVLLILGLIALIAAPKITDIIEEARIGTAKTSANNYIKVIDNMAIGNALEGKAKLEAGIYEISVFEDVQVTGTLPSSGVVVIDETGTVTACELVVDGYKMSCKDGSVVYNEEAVNIAFKDGTAIYYNPTTDTMCNYYKTSNSELGVKDGCLKWYIYGDSEETDEINLLLDHNLLNYDWGEMGQSTYVSDLELDMQHLVSNWTYTPNFMTLEDIFKIINFTDTGDINIDNPIYLNKSDFSLYGKTIDTYKWLYSDNYLIGVDDYNGDTECSNWRMNEDGYLYGGGSCNYDGGGLRPTITIQKDVVKLPATSYKYNNGSVVYYDPVNNKKCNDYTANNSNVGVKTGCMKWYAFNDSINSNTVNLLLDHNVLNYSWGEFASANLSVFENSMVQLLGDWQVNTKRFLKITEIFDIVNYPDKDDFENIIENPVYIGRDGFTYRGHENTLYSWLYSDNYLLGVDKYNSDTSCEVWRMSSSGYLDGDGSCNNDGGGFRPVISVSKKILN